MQLVAVDILGPFPTSSSGNSYILTVGDYFTRWMEAYPLPNQEGRTVAEKLTNEFFLRFSPPEQLHSDQGRQFESHLVAEVCKLLSINKTRTTPYHPQSDGLIERFNRTLLSMLASSGAQFSPDWEDYLRPLCMAYNSSVNPTTGYTPFFLMFGRQVRMPIDVLYGQPSESQSSPEYAAALRSRLERDFKYVRQRMRASLATSKGILRQESSRRTVFRREFGVAMLTCSQQKRWTKIASSLDWTLQDCATNIACDLPHSTHAIPKEKIGSSL